MKQVRLFSSKIFINYSLFFLALFDICMTHAKSDNSVKYMSVFFHVYHIEKILANMKEIEHFDNSSINAHVNLF
jgi:hypothetical protein